MDNPQPIRSTQMRQLGLVDLFAMTAFVMPMCAAIARVKRLGGGSIRYLVALPIGIGLGTLIVSLEWKIGKAIWYRFGQYSDKVKNVVGIFLFVIQLFWIFVGLVTGDKLGTFIAKHLHTN